MKVHSTLFALAFSTFVVAVPVDSPLSTPGSNSTDQSVASGIPESVKGLTFDYIMLPNSAFPNGTLEDGTIKLTTISDCEAKCELRDKCVGFTFDFSQKACKLKSQFIKRFEPPNQSVAAFVNLDYLKRQAAQASKRFRFMTGYGYEGDIIKEIVVRKTDECAEACRSEKTCVGAVSLDEANSSIPCLLYSSLQPLPVFSAGLESYILIDLVQNAPVPSLPPSNKSSSTISSVTANVTSSTLNVTATVEDRILFNLTDSVTGNSPNVLNRNGTTSSNINTTQSNSTLAASGNGTQSNSTLIAPKNSTVAVDNSNFSSGLSTILAIAEKQNTTYDNKDGSSFIMLVGRDYPGNDLDLGPADSEQKCLELCAASDKCAGFVKIGTGCTFKTLIEGRGSTLLTAITYVYTLPAQVVPNLHAVSIDGMVFQGNDLSSVGISTTGDCSTACMAKTGCVGWVFANERCELKSKLESGEEASGKTTFYLTSRLPL